MGTLIAALPRESDELNTSQMLEYTRTLFWRFTAADDRPDVGARLEAVLPSVWPIAVRLSCMVANPASHAR
jgi:hypothetical protein